MKILKENSGSKLQQFQSSLYNFYRYIPGVFVYALLVWVITIFLTTMRYFSLTTNELYLQPDKGLYPVTLLMELLSFLTHASLSYMCATLLEYVWIPPIFVTAITCIFMFFNFIVESMDMEYQSETGMHMYGDYFDCFILPAKKFFEMHYSNAPG